MAERAMPRRRLSANQLVFRLVVGAIIVFLLVPTIIVIPMSVGERPYIEFPPTGFTLDWYAKFFGDADWVAAIVFSLRIAVATTLAATVIGTLAALAMVRGHLPGATLFFAMMKAKGVSCSCMCSKASSTAPSTSSSVVGKGRWGIVITSSKLGVMRPISSC